jgi:hypothetical protein
MFDNAEQLRWDNPFPRTGCILDALSIVLKRSPICKMLVYVTLTYNSRRR